jgi:hypothetical protein
MQLPDIMPAGSDKPDTDLDCGDHARGSEPVSSGSGNGKSCAVMVLIARHRMGFV